MAEQDFEFLITQYLDGELAEQERAALEQRLAQDPAAREMLESYRKLDAAMKRNAAVPAVRWDAFANHISSALDRLGEPVQSYRIFSARWAAVAVAALALIAFGTFMIHQHQAAPTNIAVIPQTSPEQVATVDVMTSQTHGAATNPVADVTIGPPAQNAVRAAAFYGDAVTLHPSRVYIAGDPGLNGPPSNTQ